MAKNSIKKNQIIIAVFLSTILLISPTTALGFKTFENKEVTLRSVTYKTGGVIVVEDAQIVDEGGNTFGLTMNPTVANENRGYSARTVSQVESPYGMTLMYVDEQRSTWTIQNDGSTTDPRIFVNGTQLDVVQVNGVNITEGAGNGIWTYTAGNQNRVNLFLGPTLATDITFYFPQNNFTEFATIGRTLEGNHLSGHSIKVIYKILNYLEPFNPNPDKLGKLEKLLVDDKEKLYNILLKVFKNKFDSNPSKMKQAAKVFLDRYKEAKNDGNLDQFYQDIRQKIRNALPPPNEGS